MLFWLSYAGMSSRRPDLNRQPSLYESAALPLCYDDNLEQARGLEPLISALATRCSTTEPRLQRKTRVAFQTPSWRTAPHLIVAATIVHTFAGRALGYPLSLVEVRGIEPPVPSSQTTYPTVGPHLENVFTYVGRQGIEP